MQRNCKWDRIISQVLKGSFIIWWGIRIKCHQHSQAPIILSYFQTGPYFAFRFSAGKCQYKNCHISIQWDITIQFLYAIAIHFNIVTIHLPCYFCIHSQIGCFIMRSTLFFQKQRSAKIFGKTKKSIIPKHYWTSVWASTQRSKTSVLSRSNCIWIAIKTGQRAYGFCKFTTVFQ